MIFMTPLPRKLVAIALVFAFACFSSASTLAADSGFYRVNDYSKWVKANKSLLVDAVKAIQADDKLFSVKYDQDSGLSASAGHGAPAKLYSGKNAALFESVLESQFASMIIKKQSAVGFLVPETFQCGSRACAVEFFFTQDKPDISACKDGAFSDEKGKCVFDLDDHWYLKYYWRS